MQIKTNQQIIQTYQIEIIFSHDIHLTFTPEPDNRSNFFEPHFGQIGQDLKPMTI